MAAGALLGHLDAGGRQSRPFELQPAAFAQIELPLAQFDFAGDGIPQTGPPAEGIAHRAVDFVFVGADAGADRRQQPRRVGAEIGRHGADGLADDAGGGAAPTGMNGGRNLVLPIVEQHRDAIGDQHPDHHPGLIGDDGIAFDAEKVGQVGIGLVDHQHVGAVDLVDGQQQVRLQIEGPGQGGAIALDVVAGVLGIEAEVEGIEGGPADPAIAGGETCLHRAVNGPAGLQVGEFLLFGQFHRELAPERVNPRPAAAGPGRR